MTSNLDPHRLTELPLDQQVSIVGMINAIASGSASQLHKHTEGWFCLDLSPVRN